MDVKKENFKRVSSQRVNKIVDLISRLDNLRNSEFYEYNDNEIDEIFKVIESELEKQQNIFIKDRTKVKKRVEL